MLCDAAMFYLCPEKPAGIFLNVSSSVVYDAVGHAYAWEQPAILPSCAEVHVLPFCSAEEMVVDASAYGHANHAPPPSPVSGQTRNRRGRRKVTPDAAAEKPYRTKTVARQASNAPREPLLPLSVRMGVRRSDGADADVDGEKGKAQGDGSPTSTTASSPALRPVGGESANSPKDSAPSFHSTTPLQGASARSLRWSDICDTSDDDEPQSKREEDGAHGAASPTLGSRGHPFSCAAPCKYSGRSRGCKDGSACVRCHLCRWTNAAGRAHRSA